MSVDYIYIHLLGAYVVIIVVKIVTLEHHSFGSA